MTAPMTATTRLQMLKPVTPAPTSSAAINPPTIAPTMPSTISIKSPEPDLLTILLAMNPAMRPKIIHAITPLRKPPLSTRGLDFAGWTGKTQAVSLGHHIFEMRRQAVVEGQPFCFGLGAGDDDGFF